MTALERLKQADKRERPDDAFIQQIRERYPTEDEVDVVMTRKMRRRHGPAYQPMDLERLMEASQRLIESNLGYAVAITDAKRLSGGASKLQVVFTLRWRGPEGSPSDEVCSKLVLRTEPAASVAE